MQFAFHICSLQDFDFINFFIAVLLCYKYLNLPQMKKIILLVLILVVSWSLIVSDKALTIQAREISEINSKKPETSKWEYLKDRAFDDIGNLTRGYNKPVLIKLNQNYTLKDSLIVKSFIEKLKVLIPSIKIGFELDKGINPPFHHIALGFSKKSFGSLNQFFIKRDLPDQTTIYRSRDGFIRTSVADKHSFRDFNFPENISDQFRKMYIEYELYIAVFSSKATTKSFNNLFPKTIFNNDGYSLDYGFFGNEDEFLLKKLYAENFESQFNNYLYNNYPWRYAYSFLNKEKMKFLTITILATIGILVFLLMFSFFQNRRFKYSYLSYLFPIFLITLNYANLTWIYSYLTDSNSFIGWEENVQFGLVFSAVMGIIISLVLLGAEKLIVISAFNISFRLLLKILFTFIAFNLPFLAILYLTTNENWSFTDLNFIEFYYPWLMLSVFLSLGRGLLIYLKQMSDNLVREKDLELSQLKQVNAESETKLLQSQINPHFLYNSLNSIASLAPIDANKTQKMAHSLSDLFKYSINRKGKEISTVKDEIDMVKSYLDIEKIRFGDRLQFDIEVDETLLNHDIPLFLIQPLVENAVKHGISQNEGEGTISLKIDKKENELSISVSDNGPDFPKGLVSGHGLQTVYDLLSLSYGDSAALNWTNTPEKTITISIPETV